MTALHLIEGGALRAARILDPRDPITSARAFVAERFTAGGLLLIHHHRGEFFVWNRSCYRSVDAETIRAWVWCYLEDALRRTADGSLLPFQPNRARVGDVIEALAAVTNLSASVEPPAWLDDADRPPALDILPLANGLLHLPTGELSPPTPAFFGVNVSDIIFNPTASPPARWLTFLDEVFESDDEAKSTLQDWAGYLLTPDTRQQKILLIEGPKRSGKGTVARVLTALLGRANICAPTLAGLSTNFGLQPLIGKTAAIVPDLRISERYDGSIISERLLSISGEDTLTIDRKYLTAWSGKLPTRIIILTNLLPKISDASGALASRFLILQTATSFFGREDPGLTDKLLAETPAILNWAIVGYRRLHERGYFVQPRSAQEALEELELLGAPVNAFVRECCTVRPGLSATSDELYRAWQAWCSRNSRHPGEKAIFGRNLKHAVPGLGKAKSRSGGGRSIVYHGIDIRHPYDPD